MNINSIKGTAYNRFFPALAHRDFRLLWISVIAADSSTLALITARAWLAKDMAESHGNTWVGITIFAGMIPFIIFPPFSGYLADRLVRKHLLASTFMLALVQSIILTVLALSGAIQMWHLVALSFINGIARSVQSPTAFSLVANLVPKDLMLNAYALNTATFHASRLLGPGLIAPLLAVIEPGWVFLFCNVPYFISLLLVFRIRNISSGIIEPTRGVLFNLVAGFRYTYSHRALLMIVVLIACHCALTMSFESLMPVLSEDRFNWGGSGVAYLMMAVGAGAMTASIYLAGVRGEQLRGRLLFISGVLSAITPVGLAIAPNMAIGMIAASFMGATQTTYMVITLTMMQAFVPDGIRGRISSIYIIHAGGIMSFANLGNGTLADIVDPGWILLFGGIAFLGVALISLLGPTMRRIYWNGLPAQVETRV